MITISTHVLDTSSGKPGAGIETLLRYQSAKGEWIEIAKGVTNADGRIPGFIPEGTHLEKGVYRMLFQSGTYFSNQGIKTFYPYVMITFEISDESHYHIPLLLSPFGFTTYRGS
ncbi:MAG: hydroxyisourate hydrolase [Bacteroidia bacterium]|nr:hydroxyisourate hydrolase [Bacteroidia bacterium]